MAYPLAVHVLCRLEELVHYSVHQILRKQLALAFRSLEFPFPFFHKIVEAFFAGKCEHQVGLVN